MARPVSVILVNLPVPAVVAPIFVVLIPVAVVLKLLEVKVTAFAPKLSEEADIPDKDNVPDVAVRFKAPVVKVNPSEAVSVFEKVFAPAKVCVPVVTTPPKAALAGSKFRTCPVKDAPLAFGIAPMAAKVTSPVFVPERFDPVIPALQAKAPVEFVIVHPVEADPPPIRISPVEVPFRFSAPDAPPSIFIALAPVEVTVPAPAKESAVAVTPIVSIDETPVSAPPVVTFKPPLDVRENVPVPLPIVVFPVPVVAIFTLLAPEVPKFVSPVEDSVVKAPVFGVPEPIVPGAAQVLPNNVEAFIVPEFAKFNEAPVSTTIAAVVFVLEVIPENGTEVAVTVLVQLGAAAPFEIKNCPAVPAAVTSIESASVQTTPPFMAVIFLFVPP